MTEGLTRLAGVLWPDRAPPDDTTSSMVYRITMVSLAMKPFWGFSSTDRFTNLRYPWQFRAFGSWRAQLILTAPCRPHRCELLGYVGHQNLWVTRACGSLGSVGH